MKASPNPYGPQSWAPYVVYMACRAPTDSVGVKGMDPPAAVGAIVPSSFWLGGAPRALYPDGPSHAVRPHIVELYPANPPGFWIQYARLASVARREFSKYVMPLACIYVSAIPRKSTQQCEYW